MVRPLQDDRPFAGRAVGRICRYKVKIAKINVDDNPNTPMQFGVRGIPALFMFKGGEVVSNKTGAAPKSVF